MKEQTKFRIKRPERNRSIYILLTKSDTCISKIINLYLSGNNMMSIIDAQNEEIKSDKEVENVVYIYKKLYL